MASLIPLELELEFYSGSGEYIAGEETGDSLPIAHSTAHRHSSRPARRKLARHSTQGLEMNAKMTQCVVLEWKKAMAEVKREYNSRKYQLCSARCRELLDRAKNTKATERAYLIFLRFYAASALESQVRSLHHKSPHRLKLLREAREHYSQASGLLSDEGAAMARQPANVPPSPASCISSSTESTRSQSPVSMRTSSPMRSALLARGSEKSAKSPGRPVKQVSFSNAPLAEPFIRPDSPTLGFDEWLGRSTPDLMVTETLVQPDPPQPIPPLQLFPGCSSYDEEMHQQSDEEAQELPPSVSLSCYKGLLASLGQQIARHGACLDADIAAAKDPVPSLPTNEEMRALELRSRIDRLRASGWPRRKFDARRYEALRDDVAADMMG